LLRSVAVEPMFSVASPVLCARRDATGWQ